MKLISKGLLIFIVFLISVIFVNAVQPEDCNNAGGIWCGSVASGKCVYPTIETPNGFGTETCTISENMQLIKTPSYNSNNYQFKSLNVPVGKTLSFYYESTVVPPNFPNSRWNPDNTPPTPSDILGLDSKFLGGNFGLKGTPNGGGHGGDGGRGGNTSSYGELGRYASSPWKSDEGPPHCGGWGGFYQTRVGANIKIYSEQLTINGVINISGWPGNDGMNARCDDDVGYGGGGGGGGSGAGTILIITTSFQGSGEIILNGGKGGNGGNSNQEDGKQCEDFGSSADPGSGGGGGGGGAGGKIFTTEQTIPMTILNNIECKGGDGGIGGCKGWGEEGHDGEQGEKAPTGIGQECIEYVSTGTETDTPNGCRDGKDNDFDNAIDFADTDCQVQDYCPNFTISALINGAASDGSDGCCGDDPAVCYPTNSLPNFAPCNYNSQQLCDGQQHCKWESNACVQKTHQEYCEQFSQSSCPQNICQVQSGDYGYVTPDNKYLCYNNKSNFDGGTTDKWMWIFAQEKPFTITPLNFSGKTVDYISNSDKWYYCDANAPEGLKGLPVVEYSTFPESESYGLTMTCSVAASYLMKSPYFDCGNVPNPDCCFNEGSFNLINEPEKLRECRCVTGSTGGETRDFCEIEEHKNLDICKGLSFTKEKILTEYCAQNPRNCIDLDYYDTNESCDNQPFGSGHTCLEEQVCSNGLMLPVKDEEMCCIGISSETECIDKSQITNEEICANSGGQFYTPTDTTFCVPEEQAVEIGSEGCCFGVILQTNKFPWSSFENRNNNTFSCFAYQGNSLFGQCCYGECKSLTLFTNTFVDAARNRAFSIKLPYNIQNSYDMLNTTSRILQDNSLLTTEVNHIFDEIAVFTGKKNISMAYYDNLEFDIIYNRISNVQKIFINDIDYGSVTQYVNNGDRRGVAHHVKIPLRPESKMQHLKQIRLTTDSQNVKLLYDNIYFSINNDTVESSLNYYCTGGFGSWIKDMDPPLNTPLESEFFVGENAWMEGYGRYAEVCRTYLPYSWTGHYCCGDDTNGTNYGEHYEDSPNPTWRFAGGCFNGSTVINTETVWKVKGYVEDNTYFFSKDDELKAYAYSDLIYYNNSFIGCQVPEGKYSNLRISIDGNNPSPTNNQLVNDTVSSQCVVIGTYYCMNGIWRQYIPGIGQEYVGTNNIYTPSIPSSLELKSIPPAAELIKNGDFGGECPPEICNYQQ